MAATSITYKNDASSADGTSTTLAYAPSAAITFIYAVLTTFSATSQSSVTSLSYDGVEMTLVEEWEGIFDPETDQWGTIGLYYLNGTWDTTSRNLVASVSDSEQTWMSIGGYDVDVDLLPFWAETLYTDSGGDSSSQMSMGGELSLPVMGALCNGVATGNLTQASSPDSWLGGNADFGNELLINSDHVAHQIAHVATSTDIYWGWTITNPYENAGIGAVFNATGGLGSGGGGGGSGEKASPQHFPMGVGDWLMGASIYTY